MITSISDYKEYLEADRLANGKNRKVCIPYIDVVWKQLKLLRKYEYHLNCMSESILKNVIIACDRIRYKKISIQTGISIAPNCFGKGLTIYHNGCIVCNPTARGGQTLHYNAELISQKM